MTEKRFSIAIDSNNLKSLWDNERTEEEPLLYLTRSDRIGGIDNVCELLNELNDENKELKTKLSEFDFLKNENKHMRTVINENMQLKKLLRKISNPNGEIWLDNGEIIRLKKVFKGEWVND